VYIIFSPDPTVILLFDFANERSNDGGSIGSLFYEFLFFIDWENGYGASIFEEPFLALRVNIRTG
jgi:hypothetical protein